MALKTSYSPNYYSIEDILATQERVPCKFLINVPKLGELNPSVEEKDLKTGTVLELPLWLVIELSSGRQPTIAPELPKIYKEAYREILKADANAVDLHKFNLHFYELGSYVKQFDRRGEVAEILIHTFKTRFRQIMDLAENVVYNPTAHQKLDTLERRLFRDSHEARLKLNKWLKESDVAIGAANMVINHKKRKRVNVEDIF